MSTSSGAWNGGRFSDWPGCEANFSTPAGRRQHSRVSHLTMPLGPRPKVLRHHLARCARHCGVKQKGQRCFRSRTQGRELEPVSSRIIKMRKGGALFPLLVLRSVSAVNTGGSCFVASGFGPLHGFGSCWGYGGGLTRRPAAFEPRSKERVRWLISAADVGKAPGRKGPKPKTLSIDRLLQQQGFGTRKFCKSLVQEVMGNAPPPISPGRGFLKIALTTDLRCAGIRHCYGARSD